MREHLTTEEIHALTAEERYDLIYARRPSYLAGAKGAIEDSLDQLDSAVSAGNNGEIIRASRSIIRKSIVLMLAEEGREEYTKAGVRYSMGGQSDVFDRIKHNHWIYDVHRSEFPEFFEVAELYSQGAWDAATETKTWPEVSPYLLGKVYEYAERGLSSFPEIAPLEHRKE